MTDEVLKASQTMEDSIIKYLKTLDIEVTFKNKDAKLQEVARTSYLRGTQWY
jgi:hypothetical protein